MKNPIRTIHFTVCAIILFGLVAAAGRVHAEDSASATGKVFIGIQYANHDIDMDTQFTRRIGGVITEQATFDNNYTSNAGGLFVGYKLPYEKFYISGQVFFDIFDDSFELSAGSSKFTNTLNHAFGIALMPGVYLLKDLSVFGKLGWVSGDFDFSKASPTSTTYDINRNLTGYSLGFGIAYDITSQFTAKIGYEHGKYEETEINATLATRTEKTLVEPQLESFFLTLQYNFK
jgi:opacity protein-like surface antigen